MLDPFDDVRLCELVLLDRIAVLGTITAAARELGIPKPTASRWLVSLEQRVGVPLLHRTTRSVALTEPGRRFHPRVREILAAARQARAALGGDQPGGTLRVSVPVPLGRMLAGRVIAAFRAELPQVRLEIRLQNERVELVRDRIDLAIRGGDQPDSDLVARRLASIPLWLYASAALWPAPVADLPLIAAPGDAALLQSRWPGLGPPVVVVDDRIAVAEALGAGAGIGVLPAFLGEPARGRGDLVRVGDQPVAVSPVHAVFLPAQRGDARIRTLVDLIEAELVRTGAGGSSR